MTVTGMSAGKLREEIGEIGLVLRHEQHLRRPADAEPGQLGERLVRQQPPAQLGHAGFQVSSDVGKGHRGYVLFGATLSHRHSGARALAREPGIHSPRTRFDRTHRGYGFRAPAAKRRPAPE